LAKLKESDKWEAPAYVHPSLEEPKAPPKLPRGSAVLPTDSAVRKSLPVYSGVVKYFPLALLRVGEVSRIGNDKHNPGEPLHWSRDKSADHMDAAVRHIMDYASGQKNDPSGSKHLANAIWRQMAQLQLDEEADDASQEANTILR
jgi:hypothetical protein